MIKSRVGVIVKFPSLPLATDKRYILRYRLRCNACTRFALAFVVIIIHKQRTVLRARDKSPFRINFLTYPVSHPYALVIVHHQQPKDPMPTREKVDEQLPVLPHEVYYTDRFCYFHPTIIAVDATCGQPCPQAP